MGLQFVSFAVFGKMAVT